MSTAAFPQIMGVVNVTPDSFSDGGRYEKTEDAIACALQLVEDGADILDIGGESTRPGAEPVPESVEIERVLPVIRGIREHNSTIRISVDTSRSTVARVCIAEGVNMINDVTAGRRDPEMFSVAAKCNVPLIIMHMQGEPRTMQDNPTYTNVVKEVKSFLRERAYLARAAGVHNVMVDPGIGFGKQLEHNLALLKNLDKYAEVGQVVVGVSRKRFLGTMLGIERAEERDVATTMLHALLLQKNVAIIRVHNVALLGQLRTLQSALV